MSKVDFIRHLLPGLLQGIFSETIEIQLDDRHPVFIKLGYTLDLKFCPGEKKPFRSCTEVNCDPVNNPQCDDVERIVTKCTNPHVIYLSARSPEKLKVGICNQSRLLERIIENGASVFAQLTVTATWNVAKQIENQISTRYTDISQIQHFDIKEIIQAQYETTTLKFKVDNFAKRIVRDLGLPKNLYRPAQIIKYPIPDIENFQIIAIPKNNGSIVLQGEVIGFIGHFMFLNEGENNFCVNFSELEGGHLAGSIIDNISHRKTNIY